MIFFFNKAIKNILSNCIPHETVICDDRDPPWINSNIEQLTEEKNNTFRSYILNDKNPQLNVAKKNLTDVYKKN